MTIYRSELRPEAISQGDIFEGITFYRRSAGAAPEAWVRPGMVTSHSCDLDKYGVAASRGVTGPLLHEWPVTVAPVLQAVSLTGGQAGDALKGRMPRYFPLPSDGNAPDYVVDLWLEQPVPFEDIASTRRLASLTDDGQRSLWIHSLWLRSRMKPRQLAIGTGEDGA